MALGGFTLSAGVVDLPKMTHTIFETSTSELNYSSRSIIEPILESGRNGSIEAQALERENQALRRKVQAMLDNGMNEWASC